MIHVLQLLGNNIECTISTNNQYTYMHSLSKISGHLKSRINLINAEKQCDIPDINKSFDDNYEERFFTSFKGMQ